MSHIASREIHCTRTVISWATCRARSDYFVPIAFSILVTQGAGHYFTLRITNRGTCALAAFCTQKSLFQLYQIKMKSLKLNFFSTLHQSNY